MSLLHPIPWGNRSHDRNVHFIGGIFHSYDFWESRGVLLFRIVCGQPVVFIYQLIMQFHDFFHQVRFQSYSNSLILYVIILKVQEDLLFSKSMEKQWVLSEQSGSGSCINDPLLHHCDFHQSAFWNQELQYLPGLFDGYGSYRTKCFV